MPIEVLVVDDDDLVRRMLVKVLERRGFITHSAADGATALDLLHELDVDVVLLDQGLPDINGTDVLALLRSSPATATLPVILVTGEADIQARVGGLGAGADDYVIKPVNMDELVARVRAQIRGRDAWRSQVQDKLHERAQLAGALAAIESNEDPMVGSAKLVKVLRQLPGVRSVSIIAFSDDQSMNSLASGGSEPTGTATPLHLDPLVMAEVRQAVARGAAALPPVVSQTLLDGAEGEMIALGVSVGGRVMAVVLLETAHPSIGERGGSSLEVLSAAIDFSPLVQRVLSPALESSRCGVPLNAQVRSVIDGEQFSAVYQPIVDLATGRIKGFEALTRFDDGVRPDQRFAEAAHTGLSLELEAATLRRALETGNRLPAGCYLSVNVSASFLTGVDMGPILDLAPDRQVVLELTEHERIDEYIEVREAVERLGRNLRLSVDDAGSGWASMKHVFSLTPDFVKLDRMWVSMIHQDRARQALLLGMSRFVAELGGVLVAEGIETPRELATLRSLGIDFGQGYLLGRPLPIDIYECVDLELDVTGPAE